MIFVGEFGESLPAATSAQSANLSFVHSSPSFQHQEAEARAKAEDELQALMSTSDDMGRGLPAMASNNGVVYGLYGVQGCYHPFNTGESNKKMEHEIEMAVYLGLRLHSM